MLTVEQIEQIRRAYYVDKKSMRQIAREMKCSRNTVKQAIESAEPRRYTLQADRPAPKLDPYKEQIAELVAKNETLPVKQRYTWKKIYKAIRKMGYQGSASNLRHYLSKISWKKKQVAVFMPLEFEPGEDGQVDWGEAQVIMGGVAIKVQLFVLRLCYSRRSFVMAFPHQRQEAFFMGHVQAFHYLGGVPQRLTYDNLKAAVYRILEGRNREEQASFIQFRSHYLFDSHYCTPGAGHQKGGVEHGVGYARRNFLVPLPEVASFAELNAQLLAACREEDQRRVAGQPRPIGEMWQEELPVLRSLPEEDYACHTTVAVTLTPYSQVIIDTNRYSVPTDRAVKSLVAKVSPFEVVIYRPDEAEPLARHPRCYGRKQDIFDPLHYLPLLGQRPGSFKHAKPIRQWRQQWPTVYETLLNRLQTQWPEGRGLQEFIRILRLHERYPAPTVEEAVNLALEYGCLHADGVALCLQQLVEPQPEWPALDLSDHPHLQTAGTQTVHLDTYDQLLGGE